MSFYNFVQLIQNMSSEQFTQFQKALKNTDLRNLSDEERIEKANRIICTMMKFSTSPKSSNITKELKKEESLKSEISKIVKEIVLKHSQANSEQLEVKVLNSDWSDFSKTRIVIISKYNSPNNWANKIEFNNIDVVKRYSCKTESWDLNMNSLISDISDSLRSFLDEIQNQ
ncbi:MAG: hypothetical protein ACOCV1_02540 [Bacillota bacterium]